MKKKKLIIALLLALIVMTMITAAFAGPVLQCPMCGGNCERTYSQWEARYRYFNKSGTQKYEVQERSYKFKCGSCSYSTGIMGYEERTILIK